MKRYVTMSDIGSVLVVNEDFAVAIENGDGDGEHLSYFFNSESEFHSYFPDSQNWKFNTVIIGDFYIYDYDCRWPWEAKDAEIVDKIKAKRTGCFYNSGRVAFVKWE